MANLEHLVAHDLVPVLKSIAGSLEKIANPLYFVRVQDGSGTREDRCSFCGKAEHEFEGRLVIGPAKVFICPDCAALANEIAQESLAKHRAKRKKRKP